MGDLFQVKRENKSREELILEEIFGDHEKKWQRREAEASAYMTEYIDEHHEMLDRAVITIEGLRGELRSMMTELRRQHIADNEEYALSDAEKAEGDFFYARQIRILGALEWILDSFEESKGNCFIHLCDKGCEAVRTIMKKRKEER